MLMLRRCRLLLIIQDGQGKIVSRLVCEIWPGSVLDAMEYGCAEVRAAGLDRHQPENKMAPSSLLDCGSNG